MSIDSELETWREQWQSDVAIRPDLASIVERQTRAMKLGMIGDIAVTVVMGSLAIGLPIYYPQPDVKLLGVVTWLFLAAAWLFAFLINRGKWSPTAMDNASFIDLSIRRCEARLATIWFGAILFVCELVFGLGWAYLHSFHGIEHLRAWLIFGSIPIDIVWLFTAAFFGGMIWYRRKKRAELACLVHLRDSELSDRQTSRE